MTLVVEELRVDRVRREYVVDGLPGRPTVWWEFDEGGWVPQVPAVLDHLAIGLLPWAMTSGEDLHVRGPVTLATMGRLEDYQEAWSLIHPRYRRISLTADRLVSEPSQPGGAEVPTGVLAYSGGLDANHALVAHRNGLLRYRETQIRYAALVHGFDIPIDDEEGMERACRHARAMLAPEHVDLVMVRTNWRRVVDPGWTMTFAAAIAAVLHQFSADVDRALLASGLPYHQQRIPWGTNPITDPMLGRTRFPFVTVGLGSSRVEKARVVATRPAMREHLRVCWEGNRSGENCGTCEKCVRTKLTFLAAGVGTIPALGPVTAEEIGRLQIRALAQRLELEEVLGHPEHLSPSVVSAVEEVLERHGDTVVP